MKILATELSFNNYSGMIKYNYCYSLFDEWIYGLSTETPTGTL